MIELKNIEKLDLRENHFDRKLPLSVGVLKARGCDVTIDQNYSLSNDTSDVISADTLDFSNLGLQGLPSSVGTAV